MVTSGGAEVVGGIEALGCGYDVDVTMGGVVVMIGVIRGEEVEKPVVVIGEMVEVVGGAVVVAGGVVATIGGVVVVTGVVAVTIGGVVVATGVVTIVVGGVTVVRMGEEAGGMGSETGSERRGGDGAIGSTDCDPSPPTSPWSAALPEVLEAVEEPSLLEVSR